MYIPNSTKQIPKQKESIPTLFAIRQNLSERVQLGRYSSTLILAVPLPERGKETIGGNLHESH